MASHGIDLHTHTTESDGSLCPAELVAAAAAAGLGAIAITDHDTIGGLGEGIKEATRLGLPIISGVELSVEDNVGKFHLLGYGFDPADPTIGVTLGELRALRLRRNEKIMTKIADAGLPITWHDVLRHAGDAGEVIGRPHIAAAMVEKGVVDSIQEAFDKYLASGRPLYVPKVGLSPAQASQLLHAAGGIAVMAHPGFSQWANPSDLIGRLRSLRDESGLDGLEVYYSQHTPEQTEQYIRIANDLGLVITGGSDFHGAPKPDIKLGKVTRGLPAPASLLDSLPRPANAASPAAA